MLDGFNVEYFYEDVYMCDVVDIDRYKWFFKQFFLFIVEQMIVFEFLYIRFVQKYLIQNYVKSCAIELYLINMYLIFFYLELFDNYILDLL